MCESQGCLLYPPLACGDTLQTLDVAAGHNANRAFVIQTLFCEVDRGWTSFTIFLLLEPLACFLKIWPPVFYWIKKFISVCAEYTKLQDTVQPNLFRGQMWTGPDWKDVSFAFVFQLLLYLFSSFVVWICHCVVLCVRSLFYTTLPAIWARAS